MKLYRKLASFSKGGQNTLFALFFSTPQAL